MTRVLSENLRLVFLMCNNSDLRSRVNCGILTFPGVGIYPRRSNMGTVIYTCSRIRVHACTSFTIRKNTMTSRPYEC